MSLHHYRTTGLVLVSLFVLYLFVLYIYLCSQAVLAICYISLKRILWLLSEQRNQNETSGPVMICIYLYNY